jgi:hypothetical protein
MHMDYISFLVNSSMFHSRLNKMRNFRVNIIYVGIHAVHMKYTNNIFDSFSVLVFQILYTKIIFILIQA